MIRKSLPSPPGGPAFRGSRPPVTVAARLRRRTSLCGVFCSRSPTSTTSAISSEPGCAASASCRSGFWYPRLRPRRGQQRRADALEDQRSSLIFQPHVALVLTAARVGKQRLPVLPARMSAVAARPQVRSVRGITPAPKPGRNRRVTLQPADAPRTQFQHQRDIAPLAIGEGVEPEQTSLASGPQWWGPLLRLVV